RINRTAFYHFAVFVNGYKRHGALFYQVFGNRTSLRQHQPETDLFLRFFFRNFLEKRQKFFAAIAIGFQEISYYGLFVLLKKSVQFGLGFYKSHKRKFRILKSKTTKKPRNFAGLFWLKTIGFQGKKVGNPSLYVLDLNVYRCAQLQYSGAISAW